jgi:hypothetical protein
MSGELAGLTDYDLVDALTNPLGTATMPLPNRPFEEATSVAEAEATQQQATDELKQRGYSDDQLELLRRRDYSPIQQRRTE